MVTGDRSEWTATVLFEALPVEYPIFLTDICPANRAAVPDWRHGECV